MGKELFTKLIYENPLSKQDDVNDFVLEGAAKVSFENGRMRLSSVLDEALGQKANYVFWCGRDFPKDVMFEWDFYPLEPIGLCMFFFAAKGINGKSIFDESLIKRTGEYQQYYNGDINTFHVSYFRTNFRTTPRQEPVRSCNLRKSKGFYMAAQGGDPIPELEYCKSPYKIRVIKYNNYVWFEINDIRVFEYIDDGVTHGALLDGGKAGFRQMAPMAAEYANFKAFTI